MRRILIAVAALGIGAVEAGAQLMQPPAPKAIAAPKERKLAPSLAPASDPAWPFISTTEKIAHRQVSIATTKGGKVILLSWSDAFSDFPASYNRNEFDCATGVHRSLGEGLTIAEAMKGKPGKATQLFRGTIQDQLMVHACRAAKG